MEGKTQEPMTKSGPITPTASSYITKSEGKTPRYAWVVWIVTFLVSFAAPLGQFKLVSIPLYFKPQETQNRERKKRSGILICFSVGPGSPSKTMPHSGKSRR